VPQAALQPSNGMWDFQNGVDALIDPPYLSKALVRDAADVWASHPQLIKRGTLEWMKMAKTPATRAARIAELAQSSALGLRPQTLSALALGPPVCRT